ncbi:MAG: hypothetical protein A2X64_03645 [Ignavibacteria bacterium GWF2_33_9]|nr:MAG: hypothetical protein A2X64_03645 [Ignavibacteria bacterium GWF2_33_9]
MKKILILLISLIAINSFSFAINTNKEIIDSFLVDYSLKLAAQLQENGNSEIVLKFSENLPEYFANRITDELIIQNIKVFTKSTKINVLNLKIALNEFNIIYQNSSSGNILRTIDFHPNCIIEEKSGELSKFENYQNNFSDYLNSEDISYIEDVTLPITKGKFPPEKSSWIDEILEPAIVVSASVLSVILFFSVRTK